MQALAPIIWPNKKSKSRFQVVSFGIEGDLHRLHSVPSSNFCKHKGQPGRAIELVSNKGFQRRIWLLHNRLYQR